MDPEACDAVRNLVLPNTLPRARGNAYADSLPAAQLGYQVFYDPRFSSVREMRCATCHLPEEAFGDAMQVGMGNDGKPLSRNSPSIFTAALNPAEFFWDGRADSLWSQPLFSFEDPREMASSRLKIAHIVTTQSLYRSLYDAAFGAPPDLSDETRFPPEGKPGDQAFDAMAPKDQDVVNRVFSNVGKALEAYMRKVAVGRAPLDAYLSGDAIALDEAVRRGLSTFVKTGCINCHNGPAFSDGLYHDMGIPELPNVEVDRGRAAGLPILESNPFNARGTYYDATDAEPIPDPIEVAEPVGAFRTPSLRAVALTAPYGHNGYYRTLDELLQGHGPSKLTDEQRASIVAFLLHLNGKYPERPWSNWPTN